MSSSAVLTSVRRLRSILAAQQGQEQSDEQLLTAFAEVRDDLAFAALVRRHGPMVMGVCRRVLGHEQDAEDALQATFLVLAQQAASLRHKSAVASFLHGTAFHIASKMKRAAGRRHKHESSLGALTQPRSPVDPADELSWREVRTLLDEEVARLPEKYRNVFVLCCLEDVSQAETARRLRLSEGTVSCRLTEARKRLRQRLSRRGVELTAVLAAVTVASPPTWGVPASLMASTTVAALAMAAGGNGASVVSAAVAELVKGAMASKAKIAASILLAAMLLGGASAWVVEFRTDKEPGERRDVGPPVGANTGGLTPRRSPEVLEIHGRVLDPDGKPKEGASLLFLRGEDKPQKLGITAADGRFAISVPKQAKSGYLIAQAEDFGIDFLDLSRSDPKKPMEFRLVKDGPIRGRIVNTEGRPVPGVRVAVENLGVYPNNSLEAFLAAWKMHQSVTSGRPTGEKHMARGAGALLAATTDVEGRFMISHVGDERFVTLRLSGGGIADDVVWVANRRGFDPKPYNEAVVNNSSPFERKTYGANWWHLHGPELSLVAEAGKTIRGIVKDADTGKIRSGIEVQLTRRDGSDLLRLPLRTRTDVQGRYEIHGAGKSKRYMVEVAADAAAGYMPCQVWIDDTPGYQPVAADIKVKKGVIITGKVIDKATGKAVPGFVDAAILSDNRFAKEYPEFTRSAYFRNWDTDAEGNFQVVAIPGPVLLMSGPDERRLPGGRLDALKFKPPVADAKYPQYFRHYTDHTACLVVGGGYPLQGNFCKVLEIEEGTAVVKHDIVLERASAVAVKTQDAEGRPLCRVWATGIIAWDGERAIQLAEGVCSAYAVEPGKPRLMVFYEPSKKLVGTATLKGDEKEPVAVKLGQSGAIKGQLLDADGKPLAGVVVEVRYRNRQAEEIDRVIHKSKQIATDARGAFTVDELIPQLNFRLSFRRDRHRLEREAKNAEATIQVEPGECRDLGAIKMRRVSE